MNTQQVYISEKVRNSSNVVINPATSENQTNGNQIVQARLYDGTGNPISSFSWAIDVHTSDPHHFWIFHNFFRELSLHTFANPAAAWDTSITLTDATGIVIWSSLHIDTSIANHEHTTITAKNVVWNVVTLDRPLDKAHTAGNEVHRVSLNANQNASLASPSIYVVRPPSWDVWHMKKVKVVITDNAAMDFTTFWGITALANGVLLRRYDWTTGLYTTFFNAKTNADFILWSDEFAFQTKTGWGEYSFQATVNLEEVDVIFHLDWTEWDRLELWIQDDISALTSVNFVASWHIEWA